MPTLLDLANRLADPKVKAAYEKILAHPDAIPEAKETARTMLKLIASEERRRKNVAARSKPLED